MLYAREASIPETWASTPGWFMTRAERICFIGSHRDSGHDAATTRLKETSHNRPHHIGRRVAGENVLPGTLPARWEFTRDSNFVKKSRSCRPKSNQGVYRTRIGVSTVSPQIEFLPRRFCCRDSIWSDWEVLNLTLKHFMLLLYCVPMFSSVHRHLESIEPY